MVRLLIVLSPLMLVAPLSACGGGASTDSPKGVAETIAKAASTQDASLAVAVLPPVAALEAHFDCPAESSLVDVRNKRAERAAKEFGAERSKGMEMSIAAFDQAGSETKTVKAGESWHGCTVKKDFELHESKLTLKIVKNGETDDDGETWPFMKLDGQWYFAKL